MFTVDPLFEADEHGRRLRAEAFAEHGRTPVTRRLLAGALRRAADRLDPNAVLPALVSPRC